MHFMKGMAASVVVAMGTGGAARAETYTFSTWLNPSYIFTAEGNTGWAELVRKASEGEIDFEVMTGGVLLPALGALEGIGAGVAQAGPVAPSYLPSQFPVANALGDMGFAKPDAMLLTFAYGDFMANEPMGYEEWMRNGVIFGASGSTPIYNIMCRDNVASLEDFQGMRVRVPGGGLSRVAEALGGVPVNIPGSEMYTAMERGSIDCAIGDPTQLTSGTNIIELVKSVILMPMNPAYITGMITFNPDFWKAVSEDQRRLMLDQAARAMVRTQIAFTKEAQDALDAGVEQGIALNEPDAAMQAAYDEFVANGAGGMAEIARDNLGIEDPEALFTIFRGYMDKWAGLLEGVDREDEDALTELVKTNIFDQLDMATYGIR